VETEAETVDAPPEAAEAPNVPLAELWAAQVAKLPADWSDALVELELADATTLDHTALHLAPINPRLDAENPSLLRFRAARSAGYGASAGMVGRCLERCDGEGIRGTVRIDRSLSGSVSVGTQGPVWQLDGRTV
jgi:hypothetical protein